jgi:hypothetical protein
VLAYLVTSKARRRLLELLWRRGATGTASELAKQARISFTSAYRELKLMERFGLAMSSVDDGREVYAAATDHPDADLLRGLVSAPQRSAAPTDEAAFATRRRARALGAPLQVPAEPVASHDREQVLVDAVRLSRRDATLARTIPVLIWRQRRSLDRARLHAAAHKARQKHAVGFFLALTAELAGDDELALWAESLRDHRARGERSFFDLASAVTSRELAERRTPAVARRWGYWMDLDMPTFQSTFEKFSSLNVTAPPA